MKCPQILIASPDEVIKDVDMVREKLAKGVPVEDLMADIATLSNRVLIRTAVASAQNIAREISERTEDVDIQSMATAFAATFENELRKAMLVVYLNELTHYIEENGTVMDSFIVVQGECCASLNTAKILLYREIKDRTALKLVEGVAGRLSDGLCLVPISSLSALKTITAILASGAL